MGIWWEQMRKLHNLKFAANMQKVLKENRLFCLLKIRVMSDFFFFFFLMGRASYTKLTVRFRKCSSYNPTEP